MSSTSKWRVVFVLGGPGVGKGTQCKNLSNQYQLCHLSVGDVLRAELNKPGSEYAAIIRRNMTEGRVGLPHITLALLKAAMAKKSEEEGLSVFLIDGKLSLFFSRKSHPD